MTIKDGFTLVVPQKNNVISQKLFMAEIKRECNEVIDVFIAEQIVCKRHIITT